MYKQIISAQDWFYVENIKEQDAVTVYRLAAWGLTNDGGDVHGLISVYGSHQFDQKGAYAKLISVPPTGLGIYKHYNDLDILEKKALENDGAMLHVSEFLSKI